MAIPTITIKARGAEAVQALGKAGMFGKGPGLGKITIGGKGMAGKAAMAPAMGKMAGGKMAGGKMAGGKMAGGKMAMAGAGGALLNPMREVTLMGANGARLEIKRNGILQLTGTGAGELKLPATKANLAVMGKKAGISKAMLAQGAAKAQIAKAGVAKAAMVGGGMGAAAGGAAAGGGMLTTMREVTLNGMNGATLEIRRNGTLQLKQMGGGELKLPATKANLATLGKKAGISKAMLAQGAAKAQVAKAGAAKAGAVMAPNMGPIPMGKPVVFTKAATATKAGAAKAVVGAGGMAAMMMHPVTLAAGVGLIGAGLYIYAKKRQEHHHEH